MVRIRNKVGVGYPLALYRVDIGGKVKGHNRGRGKAKGRVDWVDMTSMSRESLRTFWIDVLLTVLKDLGWKEGRLPTATVARVGSFAPASLSSSLRVSSLSCVREVS